MTKSVDHFKANYKKQSASYVKNPTKMQGLANKALEYAKKSGLDDIIDNVTLLCSYVKAVATGKYKDYSVANLALAIGALLYLINPLDVIPDTIPVVGYVDDAAVVAFAIKRMSKELSNFKENYNG